MMICSTGKRCDLPAGLRLFRRFEFPHKLGIVEKLYGRHLEQYGVSWVETSTGLAWKLDLGNPTHRWIVYGMYEGSGFLNWAREFLPHDGVVVDSGANIGQMLLYLATYVPDGKVLAFEPHKEAMDWLKECLAVNAELPVQCIQMGLSESPGDMFLLSPGPENLHGAWSQISDLEGKPVHVVRLQDYLDNRGIDTVHLWKLDVEGHEMQALHGAERYLVNGAIRAIYAELGFGNGPRIRTYLESFGYKCYLFDRHGNLCPSKELPVHINAIFLM